MAVGRNEPCPCGSGKKYKQCCIDKKVVASPKKRLVLGIVIGAIFAVAGIVTAISGVRAGGLTAVSGAIVLAIYLGVRDPPLSRGRSGGDNISFGR